MKETEGQKKGCAWLFLLLLLASFIVSCPRMIGTYLFVSFVLYLCKFAIQIFVQTRDKEQKIFVLFVHGTCARANMGVDFVHSSHPHDNHYLSLCA
jgi:hypothetical protein